MGRPLLQSERNAMLLIDVVRSYVAAGKFEVHDLVVMPDHVHLPVTVGSGVSPVPHICPPLADVGLYSTLTQSTVRGGTGSYPPSVTRH